MAEVYVDIEGTVLDGDYGEADSVTVECAECGRNYYVESS